MKGLRLIEQPRVLALLSLALALVPAGLAVMTYCDASQKDERVFRTTAQTLGEQLQTLFEQHTYYPAQCRNQAVKLDDAALAQGRMLLPLDWKTRLPHLLAMAYAHRTGDKIIVRWKVDRDAPMTQVGDDLSQVPGVATTLKDGQQPASFITRGCLLEKHRMLILLAMPDANAPTPRGYVAAWIDLDGICQSRSVMLISEGVLNASFLDVEATVPPNANRAHMSEGSARWSAMIVRGPRFSGQFSVSAPWLIFFAVGLSAVRLLLLAGRSVKLRAELSAEREIARQQRLFTQSVSHEFRTPLGIIMSGADLLDDYLDHLTPERRRELLGEIKENSRQMSEMVEQVLTLGRMESSRMLCQPQLVIVAPLCRDMARKVCGLNGHARQIDVTAPDAEVYLDVSLLGGILDNLLSNALKYSPPDTLVALGATVESQRVVFTVKDHGIGIPKEEVARVRDPFHRCANVGERPGTGLGLAIAERCVALHGGSLHIDSVEGQGTTITVTLPIA